MKNSGKKKKAVPTYTKRDTQLNFTNNLQNWELMKGKYMAMQS